MREREMKSVAVDYQDKGSHFLCVIDGAVSRCVSCGMPIEYVKNERGTHGLANHHCSTAHESAKRSANTRHEDALVRRESYGSRLTEGVAMLRQCGDFDDE